MTFAKLVRGRRMTRRFRADDLVPDALIEAILELAGRAPSAGFSQGWEYVVLRTPAEREAFWSVAGAPPPGRERRSESDTWLTGVRAAPVLVVVLADEAAYRRRYSAPDKGSLAPHDQDWPVPYWLTDTAMGAMIALLAARDAGLAALFFGVPGRAHEAVKARLGVPGDLSLLGVIALGHEERRVGGSASVRRRRGVHEFTHWGSFGAPRPDAGEPVRENADQTGPNRGRPTVS